MIISLIIIFLTSSILGWILEFLYRSYELKQIINPGFLNGPYLPIYGCGTLLLFYISSQSIPTLFKFILIALSLTVLEFITGYLFETIYKIKLWDYSKRKCNLKGYICIRFTIYWLFLGGIFYFFIYPYILNFVIYIQQVQETSVLVGIVLGIFSMDVFQSHHVAMHIKKTMISMQEKIQKGIKIPPTLSFLKIKELLVRDEKDQKRVFGEWFFLPFLYILNSDQVHSLRNIIRKQISTVYQIIEDITDDKKLNHSNKNKSNENLVKKNNEK